MGWQSSPERKQYGPKENSLKQIAGLLLIMALGRSLCFTASQAEAIGLKGASTDRLIYIRRRFYWPHVIFCRLSSTRQGTWIFGLLSGYRFLLPGGYAP